MTFSTPIKLEIDDLGKVFDLTYKKHTKKTLRKVEAFQEKLLVQIEEIEAKAKELIAADASNTEIRALNKTKMGNQEFMNSVAEFEFKLLVSGYDKDLTDVLDDFPDGYLMAYKEIIDLNQEAMRKK